MNKRVCVVAVFLVGSLVLGAGTAQAQPCVGLPTHAQLQAALVAAQAVSNGGFGLHMWGTVVDRDGIVCAVAFTGGDRDDQWPGSRVISAQKANTANSFSLQGLALSTANLYSAVQPGGSLFGLQESNPVNHEAAYLGPPTAFGTAGDPLVNLTVGGVNVFGGGLALYQSTGPNTAVLVGAVGVSGDSSCADHNIAWRTRNNLGLDYLATAGAGGVSGDPARPDNIVYDIKSQPTQMNGVSKGGWGQPHCVNPSAESSIAATLPAVQ
jgi:uncharacterized protein GlcG (DUF336 family)